MFRGTAEHYDAIYRFKDYAGEAARVRELILDHGGRIGSRLLDVGCGTGQHLAHLRGQFETEGLDLDEDLLRVARDRNPGVTFHQGDLVDFDLDRKFDVVTCLFSSIGYARDAKALESAARAFARHVAPGGLAIIEPWISPDLFKPDSVHMNVVDDADLKIARQCVSRVEGRTSILEMHHLIATRDGVEHLVDRHELFLATDRELDRAFERAGFEIRREPEGLTGRGLLIGHREE